MLPFGELNYIAVIVTTVAIFIIGAIWYGVFSKPWLAAIGKTREEIADSNNPIIYLWTFLCELVVVLVLALVLRMTGATSLVDGLVTGLIVGVGIVAAQMFINKLYESAPLNLWLINAGHHAVNLTIAGAILGAWQ